MRGWLSWRELWDVVAVCWYKTAKETENTERCIITRNPFYPILLRYSAHKSTSMAAKFSNPDENSNSNLGIGTVLFGGNITTEFITLHIARHECVM